MVRKRAFDGFGIGFCSLRNASRSAIWFAGGVPTKVFEVGGAVGSHGHRVFPHRSRCASQRSPKLTVASVIATGRASQKGEGCDKHRDSSDRCPFDDECSYEKLEPIREPWLWNEWPWFTISIGSKGVAQEHGAGQDHVWPKGCSPSNTVTARSFAIEST